MVCPKCGSKVEKDAEFCSKCGQKLLKNSIAPEIIEGEIHKKTLQDDDSKNKKKLKEITNDFSVNNDIIVQHNDSAADCNNCSTSNANANNSKQNDELIVKYANKKEKSKTQQLQDIASTLDSNNDLIITEDQKMLESEPKKDEVSNKKKHWVRWGVMAVVFIIAIGSLGFLYSLNKTQDSLVRQAAFSKENYDTSVNKLNKTVSFKIKSNDLSKKISTQAVHISANKGYAAKIPEEKQLAKLSNDLDKELYGKWTVKILDNNNKTIWEYQGNKEIKRYQDEKQFKTLVANYKAKQLALQDLKKEKVEEASTSSKNETSTSVTTKPDASTANNTTSNNNDTYDDSDDTEYYYDDDGTDDDNNGEYYSDDDTYDYY